MTGTTSFLIPTTNIQIFWFAYPHNIKLIILKWKSRNHLLHWQCWAITVLIYLSNIFITRKGNPIAIKAVTPIFPPLVLAITNLLFVSICSSILVISYIWNNTVCDLLCLASFVFQRENIVVVFLICFTLTFFWIPIIILFVY